MTLIHQKQCKKKTLVKFTPDSHLKKSLVVNKPETLGYDGIIIGIQSQFNGKSR